MKKVLCILSLSLISLSALDAQVVLYSFGETNSYTNVGRVLTMSDGLTGATNADRNRAFSTLQMSPTSPNYLGPSFFGGWSLQGDLDQDFDHSPQVTNGSSLTGGNNGILFTANATGGSLGSLSFLMMGDATTATPLGSLDDFTLSATRTTGKGQSANARAVIRVGTDYYVSSGASTITGAYGQVSLDLSSWRNYDPASSLYDLGTVVSLDSNQTVDAVGFLMTRFSADTSTGGNVRVGIGQFEATALNVTPVPEPSTYAFIAGVLSVAFVTYRRKKQK